MRHFNIPLNPIWWNSDCHRSTDAVIVVWNCTPHSFHIAGPTIPILTWRLPTSSNYLYNVVLPESYIHIQVFREVIIVVIAARKGSTRTKCIPTKSITFFGFDPQQPATTAILAPKNHRCGLRLNCHQRLIWGNQIGYRSVQRLQAHQKIQFKHIQTLNSV
jgi:hypothetical protein